MKKQVKAWVVIDLNNNNNLQAIRLNATPEEEKHYRFKHIPCIITYELPKVKP